VIILTIDLAWPTLPRRRGHGDLKLGSPRKQLFDQRSFAGAGRTCNNEKRPDGCQRDAF